MKPKPLPSYISPILTAVNQRSQQAFTQTSDFFRRRRGVLFISYLNTWEIYDHTTKNIPRCLSSVGIPMIWLDGEGPSRFASNDFRTIPNLRVWNFPRLRGARFCAIDKINVRWQAAHLKKVIAELGGNPVIWIHGGVREELAEALPYVDVYSVFDHEHRHLPSGCLMQKAKVITFQNPTALRNAGLLEKSRFMLPPQIVGASAFKENSTPLALPTGFPSRRIGYVGSCFSYYIDYSLIRRFALKHPDWGVILQGRTDVPAEQEIQHLKQDCPNFHFEPWTNRENLAAVWREIDLLWLPYIDEITQAGAFASKTLEALYFGVPVIGPLQPKTEPLQRYFKLYQNYEEFEAIIANYTPVSEEIMKEAFQYFALEMNPWDHLARIAQSLDPAATTFSRTVDFSTSKKKSEGHR